MANTQSAGQTVIQSQIAKDDGSNTQSPQQPTAISIPGRTNAVPAVTTNSVTAGTDAAVRYTSITQSIPPPTAEPSFSTQANWVLRDITNATSAVAGVPIVGDIARGVGAVASVVRGVAFGGDDVPNSTQLKIKQIYDSGPSSITPQANVLDQYASYTYNVSIYIMSQADYSNMINNRAHTVPGSQLLMQSGGIAGATASDNLTAAGVPSGSIDQILGAVNQASSSAGRNQYFPLDYYIDDIKVDNVVPGKGTRSANAITSLSFKITEPNGISLLDNLYTAVQAYTGKKENYTSQNYLMVINFYGYDEKGNLVKAANAQPAQAAGTLADPTAVVQKFIPFQFTSIKFRISNKLTEYECQAMVPQNVIASGQSYGVIPYNVELDAGKLGELFNEETSASLGLVGRVVDLIFGRENNSSTTPGSSNSASAPPKAGSAPATTITNGLIQAMNQYEQDHVQNGIFDIANKYHVKFTDNIISDASTVPPGTIDKNKTSNPAPSNAAAALNPTKSSMDTNSKKLSATAGTTLLQFLQKTVAASTYIYDQQTQIYDPVSDKMVPQKNPTQVLGWFRIGLQAVPIGYDYKRNDYAYDITYQVSPFIIADLKSEYFPRGVFRGVHKQYYYWYTGANTQVLSYDQDYNALYYNIVNSPQSPQTTNPSDYREVEKRVYQTRSNENDQGADGKVNEPAANAATELYSPTDLSRARMTIVGDPAWIAQGEVWSGIGGREHFDYNPFLPDGSINGEAMEPLFEIAFNKPVDYDLTTGLQSPYQKQDRANQLVSVSNTNESQVDPSKPTQSYIYRAIKVSSVFSRGKFTQDLEGVLVTFPIKQDQNADRSITKIVTDTIRSTAVGNAAVNATNFIFDKVTSLANTAPTTKTAATGVPFPIAAPGAPTSNGGVIGTPTSPSATNYQSGGTQTGSTTTVNNLSALKQQNPAAYTAYNKYLTTTQQEIYVAEQRKLIAQAEKNNPGGRISQAEQNNIATAAQIYSQQQATAKANSKYSSELAKAGASTTTTTPQSPAVNSRPQIFNKEF